MSRRTEKLARLIRESVSRSVLFEVRDPRVKNVTVLGVDVAGDLRSAKVKVSILGSEKDEALALHGLRSCRGFLQQRLNDHVDLRYTPLLSFEADDSVKKSIEASRILRQIEEREGPINSEAPQEDAPPYEAADQRTVDQDAAPDGDQNVAPRDPPTGGETSVAPPPNLDRSEPPTPDPTPSPQQP